MTHATPHDLAATRSPSPVARAAASTGAAPEAVLG